MGRLQKLPLVALMSLLSMAFLRAQVSTLHIRPQTCRNVLGHIGTCMFVWECIKTEGKHLGTCVDGFLFGSCCAHNESINIVSGASTSNIFDRWSTAKPSTTRSTMAVSSTAISKVPYWQASTSILISRTPVDFIPSTSTNKSTSHFRPTYSSSLSTVTSSTTKRPLNITFSTARPFISASFTTRRPFISTLSTTRRPFISTLSTTRRPFISTLSTTRRPFISTSSTTRRPLVSTTSTTRRPLVSASSTRVPSSPLYPLWTFSGYRPTSGSTRLTTRKPASTFRPTERPYFPPRPSWEPHKTSTYYGFTSRWTTRPTYSTTVTNKFTTEKTPVTHSESSTTTTVRPHVTFPPSTINTNILEALAFYSTSSRPTTEATNELIQKTSSSTLVFTISPNGTLETLKSSVSTRPSTTARNTWRPIIVTASRPTWTLPHVQEGDPSAVATTLPSSVLADLIPCGIQNPHPQKKVVGGKNSAFGSWPWQASVRRTSFFGFSSTHRCGGALISRQWIATAGHCVDDLLLSQIKIRVGEYDFASVQEPHGYLERGVKRKVVHPRYNFFTYENDLALVQLEEVIDEVKYPHIAPICLPSSEEDLVGKTATVTGWGRLSEGGVLPSILQEVQVPIISNEKCKNMFLAAGRHEYIPEIFMCAGFEEGGRDSCQGDSGGPLQIQGDDGHWFLAGIISWGIGCAEPNMPGVCTRISKFKDWVLQNIT